MLDENQRLTLYPLTWIWLGGLHPESHSLLATLHYTLNLCLFVSILVFSIIQIFISYQDNVFYTIESVLTMFLYVHIVGKFSILRIYKSTLLNLLEQRSKFWRLEDFSGETKKTCKEMITHTLRNIKYYLGYSCLVVTSYLLQPFVTKQLPVLFYVPEGWYYFWIFTFWYLTPGIMSSIWGVDTIFYSISVPASVQLKLLAHKFEHVGFNLCESGTSAFRKEVKELIEHHNFLLWYCNEINRMSSGIFFIQFLVAIATSCMQLFIASQSEFGIGNKFKCLTYFTMQIVETAIYCFTTDLISESSAEVGNAIYRSSWYGTHANTVKKDIAIMIARSQKRVAFSGLGLVWINKETFTQIFKTALSFFTYLNTMVLSD